MENATNWKHIIFTHFFFGGCEIVAAIHTPFFSGNFSPQKIPRFLQGFHLRWPFGVVAASSTRNQMFTPPGAMRWGGDNWMDVIFPNIQTVSPTKKQKGRSKLPIPVNFLKKNDILRGNTKKTRYLRGGGKIRIYRIRKFRSSSSKKVPNWSELLDYVVKFQSLGLEIMKPMVRWFLVFLGVWNPLQSHSKS